MKKLFFTIIILAFASWVYAQTTHNIPVKTSHTTTSSDFDTTINVHLNDIVKLINYGSSNTFAYYDNLNSTPIITSSIATGGTIHQWTLNNMSYELLHVYQYPFMTYGRHVTLNFTAGIGESYMSSKISVSPCPAHEYITVDFDNPNISKEFVATIYDLNGRLLLQQFIKQARTKFDISNLTKGVYILKIQNINECLVNKFIKQ